MMRKLVPVAGNYVCEPNLRMDPDTTNEIAKEIDVIINSAAIQILMRGFSIFLEIITST